MPASPETKTRVRVLHVGTAPLSQSRREQLGAIGVDVEMITPSIVEGAFRPDDGVPIEELKGAAGEMTRRLLDADVCVLDEGTGVRCATAILSLRPAEQFQNMTTVPMVAEISKGLAMPNALGAHGRGCEWVHRAHLFLHLRFLGTPVSDAPLALVKPPTVARPPRPLPYTTHPDRNSWVDLQGLTWGIPAEMERSGGERRLHKLLTPGTAERLPAARAAWVLSRLIRHLPTEDLYLLATPEAGVWWDRLVPRDVPNMGTRAHNWLYNSPEGGTIQMLVWGAVARDGGRKTLGALPEILLPAREIVAREWDKSIQKLVEDMSHEFSDPNYEDFSIAGGTALKYWDVIPHEDPLAPDACPIRYQPTLATHRVARRYRSAPEVLRLSMGRWGARAYQEESAATQLARFVMDSPPRSKNDLDEWVRLLRTLPNGRMLTIVCQGINSWDRIDLEIVEAWPAGVGFEFKANMVPCWDANHRLVEQFTGPDLGFAEQRLMDVMRLQGWEAPQPPVARAL